MVNPKTTIFVSIILVVIGIIIAFSIVGQTSPDLVSAAESITDANNCSDFTDSSGAAWTYNQSNKVCYNASFFRQTAEQIDLPLNSLFSSSGVAYLILMAFLFIGLVTFIIVKTRFKA